MIFVRSSDLHSPTSSFTEVIGRQSLYSPKSSFAEVIGRQSHRSPKSSFAKVIVRQSRRSPTTVKMSSPRKTEERGEAVVVGGVAVRPASDREGEFLRACRDDRRKLSTPIPRPASGTPHRFWIGQGPPLPAPPPRRPINPVIPDIPDTVRRVQVAAIRSSRIQDHMQATVREIEAEEASAPRRKSPVRGTDHFGLTTHRPWSWK